MTNIKETWNKAANSWVEFLREGKDYFRDEMNSPAMFQLLGKIEGKRILDLACGEGYNSRIMKNMGASVVGIDISDKLIQYAVEQEKKDKFWIDYHVLDATYLDIFNDNSFEIVVCFMALMDIEKYQETIFEVSRVLKKKGRFIFNILHPCFVIRVKDEDFIGGWEYKKGTEEKDPDNAMYWKVDNYFDSNKKEIIPWKLERLKEHFRTIAIHRTLTEYSEALYNAKLMISRIKEPKPTKKGMDIYPLLKGCLRIPHSIVIECVKI